MYSRLAVSTASFLSCKVEEKFAANYGATTVLTMAMQSFFSFLPIGNTTSSLKEQVVQRKQTGSSTPGPFHILVLKNALHSQTSPNLQGCAWAPHSFTLPCASKPKKEAETFRSWDGLMDSLYGISNPFCTSPKQFCWFLSKNTPHNCFRFMATVC